MKTLETESNYAGHHLKQIWRKGDVAVYERSLTPEKSAHELELIFVQSVSEKVMPRGNTVLAHEAFPQPSDWGRSGFSFPIRYKDEVLALAEECASVSKDRAALVRGRRASWPKKPL